MAKKLICYPFRDGDMLDYTYYDLTDEERQRVYNGETIISGLHDNPKYNVTWRPQQEIELTLSYIGYARGRSAITFLWKDEEGHEYPMFLTDFNDMMKLGIGTNTIHAIFTYVKRGQNYGIKFLREVET